MINKIVLNGVATFREKAVFETDKQVNLLYGLNGVGKSTFSEFLYDPTAPRFDNCSVEGLDENDTVLVYTQKFVQEYFYETQDIHGIFTLSKGNTEAKKAIDKANAEIKKLTEEKKHIEEKAARDEQKHKDEIEKYKNQTWKIKTEYSGGDRVLEFCLEGFKGNRDTLFNQLLSMEKPDGSIDYSVEDLKDEAQQIQGEAQSRSFFSKITIDVAEIEKSDLLSKIIVGNKNSSVAKVIEDLGNSDWVSAGIKYVHIKDGKGKCPFCQQTTITEEFLHQINDYFDESYKKDKAMLESMVAQYSIEVEKAIGYLSSVKEDDFFSSHKGDLDALIKKLQTITEQNLSSLQEKAKTPGIQISLQSVTDVMDKINGVIETVNKEVDIFNRRLADLKGSRREIKEKFWKLMRKEYDSVISLYTSSEKTFVQLTKVTQKDIQGKESEIDHNKAVINENRKKTVNIDEAVENINNGLADIGITDFSIEKYSEEEALYRLKRDNSDVDVFKTLSEGEKMVISFLYFIELCKGENVTAKASNNRIVVIDDPISSLSHIYVFNIGRLIHNEFLRSGKYDQIFILTHSLYFFYELTNTKHEERKETQALFRICKNVTSSYFECMKYEEIQNDYQAYWHIVKDEKQAPALIANCMRNIMEYFFNFVEKQDYVQVFQRTELQETRFMAFNRYMNRESHSKGQNIFDIKEFDYANFREAFKLVFEKEGYIDHYNKMIK